MRAMAALAGGGAGALAVEAAGSGSASGAGGAGDGSACAATGLVQLIVDLYRMGVCRRLQRAEFRQLRVGAVVVDRRLHRIAIVVLQQ